MTRKIDRAPPLLRAFALLEQVAHVQSPVSLQEMTDAVQLPKPTVYRMLNVLEQSGLIAREPGGRRVVAGPRLARLALDVLMNESAHGPRHAILQRLASEVGETVNLTMLEKGEVVYVDRVESAWPLRMTLQPGSRVPLHCTASGKLLLALLPTARCRRVLAALELARHTKNTITDRSQLETELASIRRAGLATDNEEYLAGVVCVAVPVIAHGGRVAACVAVHAPVARMSLARALSIAPALRRAAGALGASFEDGLGADMSRRGPQSGKRTPLRERPRVTPRADGATR
ncbi:MAG: IclR family transcriptional regulator [Burkholderiales bacterium]|nr:IclR family transcriptional regulator [Burkholderiales bacterium]